MHSGAFVFVRLSQSCLNRGAPNLGPLRHAQNPARPARRHPRRRHRHQRWRLDHCHRRARGRIQPGSRTWRALRGAGRADHGRTPLYPGGARGWRGGNRGRGGPCCAAHPLHSRAQCSTGCRQTGGGIPRVPVAQTDRHWRDRHRWQDDCLSPAAQHPAARRWRATRLHQHAISRLRR